MAVTQILLKDQLSDIRHQLDVLDSLFTKFRGYVNERLEYLVANMATKEDLRQFATKDDMRQFATKDDLKHFATKEDLKRFATKDDLKQFVTKDDFNDLKQLVYLIAKKVGVDGI